MLQPLLIDGASVAATPVNLGRIIQDSSGLSKISFRILQGLLLSKGKGDFLVLEPVHRWRHRRGQKSVPRFVALLGSILRIAKDSFRISSTAPGFPSGFFRILWQSLLMSFSASFTA